MRSVPPRGSGWVYGFSIFDFRLPIGFIASTNRKSAIDNRKSRDPPATEAVKKIGDTTSFSCVVFNLNPGNYQESSCDTTGFSRVVLQFQPKILEFRSSAHESRSFTTVLRLKLKHHSADAGGVVAAPLAFPG